ncbi:MAG: protein kinase [Lewinellaceae bacterium]|nr:protein kinase [Lewinellaceae bacterium]
MKRCKECGYTNDDQAVSCQACQASLEVAYAPGGQPDPTGYRTTYHSGQFEFPVPYHLDRDALLRCDADWDYSVVQFIAEGGFAKVFHARGPKSGREDIGNVAVKVMNLFELHPDQQKEFTKRFEREYQVGQINSEYIVRTFAKGFISANPFMVMEYCPNGTLDHRIQGGRITEEDAKRIAVNILCGLRDLHAAGVVHRDLKPSNILFDEHNNPRVADFGISAYIRNRMTQINRKGNLDSTLGTPYYCPPEQRKGIESVRMTNPRMDIYAFGVIMYETFSGGQFPFSRANEDISVDEYYKRAEKGNHEDIRHYRSDIDPVWSELISRCIYPRPEQRFENVDEILDLLGHRSFEPGNPESSAPTGAVLLRVINGDDIGRVYNLDELIGKKGGSRLSVGWLDQHDPERNDIGILEKYTQYISSRHATIEMLREGDKAMWFIRDGQWYDKDGDFQWHLSKNGVLVNSLETDESGSPIHSNDIITIGDTKLKVEIR